MNRAQLVQALIEGETEACERALDEFSTREELPL